MTCSGWTPPASNCLSISSPTLMSGTCF
jgi:hypothetical protein